MKNTNYKRKDDINWIIYKRINNRKDESLGESVNKKSFYNDTLNIYSLTKMCKTDIF